jgi:hypothetical protein
MCTSSADLETVTMDGGSGGHLGPQEPGELPGDHGRHDGLDVLAGGQDPEPGAQALLGGPRPGGDLWWQALLAAGDLHADGGRCCKAQAASTSWARRWALPALVSRPRWTVLPLEQLAWDQPAEPHELAGRGEPAPVSDLERPTSARPTG